MESAISFAMTIALLLAAQGELKHVRSWLLHEIYKHRQLDSLSDFTRRLTGVDYYPESGNHKKNNSHF